jgi:hypothetical protein
VHPSTSHWVCERRVNGRKEARKEGEHYILLTRSLYFFVSSFIPVLSVRLCVVLMALLNRQASSSLTIVQVCKEPASFAVPSPRFLPTPLEASCSQECVCAAGEAAFCHCRHVLSLGWQGQRRSSRVREEHARLPNGVSPRCLGGGNRITSSTRRRHLTHAPSGLDERLPMVGGRRLLVVGSSCEGSRCTCLPAWNSVRCL